MNGILLILPTHVILTFWGVWSQGTILKFLVDNSFYTPTADIQLICRFGRDAVCVPGRSSWVKIISLTSSNVSFFRTGLGLPDPGLRSVLTLIIVFYWVDIPVLLELITYEFFRTTVVFLPSILYDHSLFIWKLHFDRIRRKIHKLTIERGCLKITLTSVKTWLWNGGVAGRHSIARSMASNITPRNCRHIADEQGKFFSKFY